MCSKEHYCYCLKNILFYPFLLHNNLVRSIWLSIIHLFPSLNFEVFVIWLVMSYVFAVVPVYYFELSGLISMKISILVQKNPFELDELRISRTRIIRTIKYYSMYCAKSFWKIYSNYANFRIIRPRIIRTPPSIIGEKCKWK